MFTPEERQIFHFFHPGQQCEMVDDPLRLRRELKIASHGNLKLWIDFYNKGLSPDADPETIYKGAQAEAGLILAVRKVFSLPEISDQGGVSDKECLTLLTQVIEYQNTKKKSTATLQSA